MKTKYLYIVFALLMCPLMAFSQYFRNLNVAEGLPNSVGKCFAQDGQGFIWVGTFNGLARYDGMTFTTYRHKEGDKASLANNHVESLCYDGNDGLWVGVNGGIDYMSLKTRKFSHCQYVVKKGGAPQSMPSTYVWEIFRSGKRLWAVNDHGQLLYKQADKSLVWENYVVKGQRVKAAAPYDDKHLMVLFDKSLVLFDNQTLTMKAQCFIKPLDYSCFGNLYYSHNQHLIFVGLGYGHTALAFSLEYDSRKRTYSMQEVPMALPNHVKCVQDFRDMTLFATDGQGIKAMRNRKLLSDWKPHYDQIAGNAIHSLFVDKNKTLWAGTYREGICVHSDCFDSFKSLTWANKQLSFNVVSAISADGNKIYVGTDGGGLNVYDVASHKTSVFTTANSGLTGNNIVGLYDDKAYLWIGIYGGGICRMNKVTGNIEHVVLPLVNGAPAKLYTMWKILDDKQGHLIFCGNRLFLYDKQTGKCSRFPNVISERVMQAKVAGNLLWVITSKGLTSIDLKNSRIVRKYPQKIHAEAISLYVKGEQVFYSVLDDGFYVLNIQKGKSRKLQGEALNDKEVASIVEDGMGNLWLGTDKGLVRYALKTGLTKVYGQEDYLLQSQFLPNAAFKDENNLYFGSVSGLVAFNPRHMYDDKEYGCVYFDDVYVWGDHSNHSLLGANPTILHLTYDQNFFTIRLSVPELVSPHKVKLRYKLEGLDKEWRVIENVREVSYTNVSPGSYTFLVQTTNGDGTWNKQISKLPIHVSPPWYDTWWAHALWLLIIIGIVYAVFRHYAEKQKMKHEIARKEQEKNFEIARKEQEKQHELAQKELEKQMIQKNNEDKLNFFANITHELRTPMFLITAPLEELLSSVQRPVQVPYSYLRGMYRNAVRLNKLVNNILDLRKMEAGSLKLKISRRDMVKVCKRLSVDYRALCLQKNIKFRFETDLEALGAEIDIEKVELILSNLVANAYKYTNDGGEVTLRLLQDKEKQQMQLLVSDTGIGIAKDQIEKVFDRYYRVDENSKAVGDGLGLAFVKSLVELHGGTISLESEVGKGSTFSVVLPLSQPNAAKASTKMPIVEGELQLDEEDETELELADIEGTIQSPTATQAILIIDDERETVQLLERYLGKDYKIFKAGDGEEGLRMAADVMPDLVICDVMMPKMDGFEFLGKFKDDKKLQHIPVIMFTAKILDEDKIAAFRYGADAYLTKPISLKFLKARIESFLNRNTSSLQNANLSTSPQAESHYSKEDQKFILRCKEIIDKHMCEENFGVDYMASELGMSHSALYKNVKAITSKTVVDMIVEYRIFKAIEMMRGGETNITLISERCGFNEIRSFRAAFKAKIGISPKQYTQQL